MTKGPALCVEGRDKEGELEELEKLKVKFKILICVKLETGFVCRRLNRIVIGHIVAEVLLNDVIRKLIDFNVFVVLKILDLGQAVALLDQICNLFGMRSSHFQHVVDSVQDYLKRAKGGEISYLRTIRLATKSN